MPDCDGRLRLLILGGTAEAAALAGAALERFGDRLAVITSLAGRTAHRAPLPGTVRVGGFGGAVGLATYLNAERIDLVIDATHPFAAQISAQVYEACAAASVPRLLLHRPPWLRHPLDHWIEVADMAAAAAIVPTLGRRAWLTIGARDLAVFASAKDMYFLIRLVDPPRIALPFTACEILLGRGPFDLAEERRILERYAIDVLVTKASGGASTEAKLIAARERRLPVVMVQRPAPPPGLRVDNVPATLDWLAARISGILPSRPKITG